MKVKSDLSVFFTHYLGLGIVAVGTIWGLGMVFFTDKLRVLGIIIVIISFFIGKYFVFKSKRRKGYIHYYGGRI